MLIRSALALALIVSALPGTALASGKFDWDCRAKKVGDKDQVWAEMANRSYDIEDRLKAIYLEKRREFRVTDIEAYASWLEDRVGLEAETDFLSSPAFKRFNDQTHEQRTLVVEKIKLQDEMMEIFDFINKVNVQCQAD